MPSAYDSYDESLVAMHGGAPSPLLIAGGELRIRPLVEDDLEALAGWLADERVLEFYEGRDTSWPPDKVRAHFFEEPECGAEFLRVAIEWRGAPIGYGQVYRLHDGLFAEYGLPDTGEVVYAMDQFIGAPELWGKGLGTRYVNAVAEFLAAERDAAAVVMDPRVNNPRAVRCYQKAGFEAMCLLPAHELHEGELRDCWLMRRPHLTAHPM